MKSKYGMSDNKSKKSRRSPRSTRSNKDGGGSTHDVAPHSDRMSESLVRPNPPPSATEHPTDNTMNDLKVNLTKVILSDPAILTPIVEAVADTLVTKLLSPERINAIVDKLVKSKPLVTSLVKSLESDVKQEVYQSCKMDSEDMDNAITTLEEKCYSLRNTANDLQSRLDDFEQYSRRNCLLIHGLDDSEDYREAPESIVISRLNPVIPRLNIATKNIDRAHRIGKPKQSHHERGRPRPMLVKFLSYQDRAKVFQQKRLLKGTGMAVTESLTPTRLGLLKAAQ